MKKCWHEHYILINAAVDVVLQIVVAAAVLGWLAFVPLAFIIPALVIMINVSWRPLIEKLDKRFSAEDTWMHYVMDHACNWLLVQTHEMRDQSSMEFEKKNTKFYKDHRTARFLEVAQAGLAVRQGYAGGYGGARWGILWCSRCRDQLCPYMQGCRSRCRRRLQGLRTRDEVDGEAGQCQRGLRRFGANAPIPLKHGSRTVGEVTPLQLCGGDESSA